MGQTAKNSTLIKKNLNVAFIAHKIEQPIKPGTFERTNIYQTCKITFVPYF